MPNVPGQSSDTRTRKRKAQASSLDIETKKR